MFQKQVMFILLLYLGLSPPIFGVQHALVVGINEYPPDAHIPSLEGAVNDANLLTKTLRRMNVKLPNNRVLLNSEATRANVIWAWRDMVSQAKRGDTLIFTYSGHGGQEDDQPPIDEVDEKDETLILYKGRITDDELMDLFLKAKEYKILFVADACHSGGIKALCRSGFSIRSTSHKPTSRLPPVWNLSTQGDQKENPAHVTYISAAEADNAKVCEYTFGNKAHGALSWFLVRALRGDADGYDNTKKNGYLEYFELEEYLEENIRQKTGYKQNPKLTPSKVEPNPVIVTIGPDAQWLKDKRQFLQTLAAQFDTHAVPINLGKGNRRYKHGEVLHFSIGTSTNLQQGLNAMTLFDLASNGELQFVYPLERYKDPLSINQFPYPFSFRVGPPFGEDNLVAVLCPQPPIGLQQLLKDSAPYLPEPSQIISALHSGRCQVGQKAFFTENNRW